MDMTEEPKVQVAIAGNVEAKTEVKEKKKIGRPRTKPERVERHEATPARLAALAKGRAIRAEKHKAKKERGEPPLYQEYVQAPAVPNQGTDYAGNIDMNASMRQSDNLDIGVSKPAISDIDGIQFSTPVRPDTSQQENTMNRVQILLDRYDELNSVLPSHKKQVPESLGTEFSEHEHIFNDRYIRKPGQKPVSRWMRR